MINNQIKPYPSISSVSSDFIGWARNYSLKYNIHYVNGKIHRLDGPAVVFDNGPRCYITKWVINGKEHSYGSFLTHPLVVKEKIKTILTHDNDEP